MTRVYIAIGASLALLAMYWLFSDHLIGIGKQLCANLDNQALIAQLNDSQRKLRNEVATNEQLERQHATDVRQMEVDAVGTAAALANVRVRVPACSSGQVPAATAAGGHQSGSAGVLDGGGGTRDVRLDLSGITSDLIACELDASELNRLKAWAREVVKP